MGKKLIYLVSVVVVLAPAFAKAASTGPVGWWKLDEKSGTTAGDSSKNKNHGTLVGGAAWANGQLDGAVQFDATDDYVTLPIGPLINTLTDSTFTIWANYSQQGGAWQRLFDIGTGTTANMFLTPAIGGANTGVMRFAITTGGSGAESQLSAPERLATGWHHIAVVIDAGAMNMQLYLDGAVVVSNTTATLPQDLGNTTQNWLGRSEYAADAYYSGLLDDFRIYDRTLTQEEVAAVMAGGLTGVTAAGPSPADGAVDVPRDAMLSWVPSDLADTHDVYLGLSPEDVRNADRVNTLGVLVSPGQDANAYDPPGRLEFGQTYHWRIDEVNAPPDSTIFKGNVWSFTVEPYSYPVTDVNATASSINNNNMGPEKTVDGSGLNADDQHSTTSTDMWLSAKTGPQPTWIQYEFDQTHKLDKLRVWNSNGALESLVGVGARNVQVEYSADAATWTALGEFEFAQAPGTPDYTADIEVPFGGAMARSVKLTITSNWGEVLPQYGLSEVRFFALPVRAREPQPADEATEVNPQVTLSWRAGREAASHQVLLSDDEQAVLDGSAPATTVTVPAYETAVNLAQSYYWKVIEVNEAQVPSAWDSDVWSFATAEFVTVEDFESYDDEDHRIYDTWADGWTDAVYGGSQVGYTDPPFVELSIIHGGQQAMPLNYDNTSGAVYSEAQRTFATPQDWTKHGITTLVLYFYGQSSNGPAPLYVKINDTKVLYDNGAPATAFPLWKHWNIDLAATGANLQSVKSLTIGVGDGGGKGLLFMDDIRLYETPPTVITPVDPGTGALVAYYPLDGNVQDGSGQGRHGTLMGDGGYEAGVAGQALVFNGTNAYVDLPIGPQLATLSDVTLATYVSFPDAGGAWQRIFDFGTGTTNYMFLTPRMDTGGVMRFAIRTATVAEQVVDAPATLPSGWHHVAVVIDSAAMSLTLYLDGTVVGTAATTLLPRDLGETNQNWLGRSQWAADAYLTGSLDEFRIFNRALSAAEVRHLAGDR